MRPARRNPIITGPISFVIASPTIGPSTVWLTLRSWSADWTTRTMPTKSDRVAAIGSVSAPARASCSTMRSRSVAPNRICRTAAAQSWTPSPVSCRPERMPAPIRVVKPGRRVAASVATRLLPARRQIDEPGRAQPPALARCQAPEHVPVEGTVRTGVPAEHAPQGCPHGEHAAVCRQQAVDQCRNLTGGTAVARVAAQHAEDRVEAARAPGVLVPLALPPPQHQNAIAPPEVEVAVVLLGRPVERPEIEVGADAVAVAAAVDRRQPPDAPGFIAQPALAEHHRPGCAGGLGAEPVVHGMRVGEHAVPAAGAQLAVERGVRRQHRS